MLHVGTRLHLVSVGKWDSTPLHREGKIFHTENAMHIQEVKLQWCRYLGMLQLVARRYAIDALTIAYIIHYSSVGVKLRKRILYRGPYLNWGSSDDAIDAATPHVCKSLQRRRRNGRGRGSGRGSAREGRRISSTTNPTMTPK